MRIDSRLMKTDMELEAIERNEDRLLMKSPPDDWNKTRVYLSPNDVVNTIRISLHRGMLTYILLLPFFIVADYLKRNDDVSETVFDISYVISGIFMGLLLVGGANFLLAEPITGAIILGVFAALFLLISIGSAKLGFLYLSAPLVVASYFLLAYGQQIELARFPLLAMSIVLTMLLLGKALGDQQDDRLALPLYRTNYLIILIFATYLAFNAQAYALETPWGAGLPLLAFSLFHFIRYLDTREPLQQLASMIFLSAGFLFVLYGTPFLHPAFYGLPLVALSMAMILIADRYHEALGLGQVAPTYAVAIVLALLAFAYAWQDLTALLLTLSFFSVHFFGGTKSLGLKSTAGEWGEKTFQWIEFTLANLAAGAAAILVLTIARLHPASLVAVAVYVYFYTKIGLGRDPTILQTRNQYLWTAGAFYALFIFITLGLTDPLGNPQADMLLVAPLLIPLLALGRVLQRRHQHGQASSVFESCLIAVLLAVQLPSIFGAYQAQTASLVAAVLLALFALAALLWRDEALLYPIPILLANLYFNALSLSGISGSAVGMYFIPLALLALALAVVLHRRQLGPVHTMFLAWFVLSAASILGAGSDRTLAIYLIAGWAAVYLLANTLIDQPAEPPPTIEIEAHV